MPNREYIDPCAGSDLSFEEAVQIVERSLKLGNKLPGADALRLPEAQAILATHYVQIQHKIAP